MTEGVKPSKAPALFLVLGVLLFGPGISQAAPVIPDFTRDLVLEGQGSLRFFGMGKVVEPLLEFQGLLRRDLDGLATAAAAGSRQNPNLTYNMGPVSARAGAYVKVFPGWRLGGFYSVATGIVHEDDWTNFSYGSGSDWGWHQALDRAEHQLTLDLTYRQAMPGAPGLAGELKARHTWNLTVGSTEIMIRPGIYFTPQGAEGTLPPTFFLQNEMWLRPFDLPASSLKTFVLWENWLYGGVQFSLGEMTQLGLSLAWKHGEWHDGPFWWKVSTTQPWRRGYDALVPGISLTHRFGL